MRLALYYATDPTSHGSRLGQHGRSLCPRKILAFGMLGFIAHRCPALETHVENSHSEKVAAKTMTVHPDHM
jgi:hypothetical protein